MKENQKKVDKIDKEMCEFTQGMADFSQRFEKQEYMITEIYLELHAKKFE